MVRREINNLADLELDDLAKLSTRMYIDKDKEHRSDSNGPVRKRIPPCTLRHCGSFDPYPKIHFQIFRRGSHRPHKMLFQSKDIDIPSSPVTTVWHQVDSKVRRSLSHHERYWWRTSGYALAVLLSHAGYSSYIQYQDLEFFAIVIAPYLGAARKPSLYEIPWKSFMTDDGNPIELSWDWHTGTKSPTIRFSIEPVGIYAGKPIDPRNGSAASAFVQALVQSRVRLNLEWYDHFDKQFNCHGTVNASAQEGHSSQSFFAFDLADSGVTCKAYFFPGFKAGAKGQMSMTVISQAIAAAPYCTPERLAALSVFQDFLADFSEPVPEVDMLAIDLVDPMASRLKIYFRIRETSFNSVQHTMTLGNRIGTPAMVQGLRSLKRLWSAVLERSGFPEDAQLPRVDHRTGGILYNVEFHLGSSAPKVKIYIPVRHYARSDEKIMEGLSEYLYRNNPQSSRYTPEYGHALETVL